MQINHGICMAFILQNIKEHLTNGVQMLYLRHRKQKIIIYQDISRH
jgi:hypothetical protein